jgi:hypothetical protein
VLLLHCVVFHAVTMMHSSGMISARTIVVLLQQDIDDAAKKKDAMNSQLVVIVANIMVESVYYLSAQKRDVRQKQ